MMSSRQSFAAIPLVASLAFATAAGASTDSVKDRLLASFEKAGLYRPPEVPEGCLDWKATPKGDSVAFSSRVSSEPACQGVGPIAHRWILPRRGGVPLLMEGKRRTSLGVLTGVDLPEEEPDRLLTNAPRDREDDGIDMILSGGGGSRRKGERDPEAEDRQRSHAGTGLRQGGQNGFGVGDGGTRKGKMALGADGTGKGPSVRAQIAPPKPSDVEIVGENPSRSQESILRVIRQQIGGFQYTYQKFLRNSPELEGNLSFLFTIAPSGDIASMLITKSTTGDQELDFEIKNKAQRMKFDAIEGGEVTVVYHLSLRRQDGNPAKPSEAPFKTSSTGTPSRSVVVEEGTGLRSPESILRVLIRNNGGFKYTFQKYLRDRPDLNPKFAVRLTIDASGAVLDASADKSTTGSVEADEELIGKVRNLKFDAIDQGQVRLLYLFDLAD